MTEAGRAAAARLPYESVHGSLGDTVRRLWGEVDALVLMVATGAAVRVVAPLLTTKQDDPGVVCVDEAGRYVVALCGGHGGGANAVAREVAALLGAEPVVTTATDASGTPSLDDLPGFRALGDVAGVTAAMLAGRFPLVEVAIPGWHGPAALAAGTGPERVVVTDAASPFEAGTVLLHPPSLVVGVGCSTEATPEEVARLLEATLAGAGLARASVGLVATIDRRRAHRSVTSLGLPVRSFSADELAPVSVPRPSPVVAAAVGTPSVAEAAALLAAGDGADLVVPKQRAATATVAIARRRAPQGALSVVGLGPGSPAHRTPAAASAVRSAEVVIGYGPYVDQAADLLVAGQVVESSAIGEEVHRARRALEVAASGRRTALVCSGDAGIFAMASIVLELAPEVAPGVAVDVVPGVTAGTAAASLLGAPLGHDHALVSLSDLLTPWEAIERRLHAIGEADLAVVLYNPRSRARTWQLGAALDILRGYRPPTTPVGLVTDAARAGERVEVTTLAEANPDAVGMTTCVVVGATTTGLYGGRMVTPRGYQP
ncbi:MAG: precorrin-3B C(17)-methyltransferase [Actinomycetota bacterium]|nr:precorrin-3B C(17)-methyltransferase [Actinomycetota bacterium]